MHKRRCRCNAGIATALEIGPVAHHGYTSALAAIGISALLCVAQAVWCTKVAVAESVHTLRLIVEAASWLSLGGALAAVAACLAVLAQDTSMLRSNIAKRLHAALVLASSFGAVVLLGAATSSAGVDARHGGSFIEGVTGAICAAAAGKGAITYLPFDMPTSLSLWLVPRSPARWRWLGTILNLIILACLCDAGAAIAPVFADWSCGTSGATVRSGARGAASIAAVLALAVLRDGDRKNLTSVTIKRYKTLWVGIVVYASMLTLAAAIVGAPHVVSPAAAVGGMWQSGVGAMLWVAAAIITRVKSSWRTSKI